jgi:hypothetical protein
MFEGYYYKERPKVNIEQYKIVHHCRCCHVRIETKWVNGEVSGSFIAEDVEVSEVLDIYITGPKSILCERCYNEKVYKIKKI